MLKFSPNKEKKSILLEGELGFTRLRAFYKTQEVTQFTRLLPKAIERVFVCSVLGEETVFIGGACGLCRKLSDLSSWEPSPIWEWILRALTCQ